MEIPYQAIAPDTLRNMIEEYVTRDGTDYGEIELSLDQKVDQILAALREGEATILYDEQSQLCEIVNKDQIKSGF